MEIVNADKKKLSPEQQEKILNIFEKCLVDGQSRWSGIHSDFKADKKFIQFGEQLINPDGSEQKLKGRPRFVINKLIQFVKSVSNEQRKNVMAGKVFPIDNGADPKKAEVLQGVARGIERSSNARYAYQYAGEEALVGGMGAFRIDLVNVSDKSFDQTMEINRILDASTVMASHCIKPDYSDATWFIIGQDGIESEEYSAEWYRLRSNDLDSEKWGGYEKPMEYEFWYMEETPDTLYQMTNGVNYFKSQIRPGAELDPKVFVHKDGKPKSRPTVRKKWTQYHLRAREIKEYASWPGKWAPIYIVNGRESYVDGKRKLLSLCRYSKHSQMLYNYARQEMGRKIGFSPKAIWLAAIEAIPEKFRKMWDNAHEDAYGTMYWNDKDSAGRDVPRPTLIEQPSIDSTLSQEVAVTDNELKDTTGIQNENLAKNSNATSKIAIDAKRSEGDTNTFDFTDNLAMAVQHCIRGIVDLTPKVISTKRQVRIVGEDDTEKIVTVNADYEDPKTGEKTKDYYFSEEAEYDVGVSVGPSYSTKRQEDNDYLMEIMRISPVAAEKLPYLIVKNMDFAGADQASKLLRPPGIEGEDDEAPQIPPEVQMQLQQAQEMQQQFQMLVEEFKKLKASQDLEYAKIEERFKEAQMKNDIDQQKVDIEKFEAIKGTGGLR